MISLKTRFQAQCCESDTIHLSKDEICQDLGGEDLMAIDPIVSDICEESQICGAKFLAEFSSYFLV
jgi:hypothetical protein